jgi:hypothetical protein
VHRTWCGGGCAITADTDGNEPVRVRGVPQGFPTGPKPAAAPTRPQHAMEAEAKEP